MAIICLCSMTWMSSCASSPAKSNSSFFITLDAHARILNDFKKIDYKPLGANALLYFMHAGSLFQREEDYW